MADAGMVERRMMDLERLDEALEFYGHPNSYTGHEEVVLSAAAAYRDLLANRERVEPDYERAIYVFRTTPFPGSGVEYAENVVRAIVDAAIGDRLQTPPTKEDLMDLERLNEALDFPSDEDVEVAARALFELKVGANADGILFGTYTSDEQYRTMARAALQAVADARRTDPSTEEN